ncbi:MAG: patatin-like phospholipase family protein, partial [Candidatus Dojkabacteria bacterium]
NSLIGSSGGALIAVAYACGHSPKKILQFFKDFNPYKHEKFLLAARDPHLVDQKEWIKYATKVTEGRDLSELDYKVRVQATNIRTQNIDYLSQGDAATAVIASSAFPGLVKPVEFLGEKYIDGDVDIEYGAEVHRDLGSEVVVGLSAGRVELEKGGGSPLLRIGKRLIRPIEIMQTNMERLELELNPIDMLIEGYGKNYKLFDFKYLEQIYEQGYKLSKKKVGELKKLLNI